MSVVFLYTASPSPGLYFTLMDVVYLPGDTILISDVGSSASSLDQSDPGESLVCVTSNVNTQCCRTSDGGNVGEWLFPNGSVVMRSGDPGEVKGDFERSFSFQEVRLDRANVAVMPSGVYECRVPSEGNGSVVHTASITLAFSECLLSIEIKHSFFSLSG